jgi:hypothetical protein
MAPKPIGPRSEKACTKCGVLQRIDAFPLKSASSDGRNPWCRQCHSAYQKENRERANLRTKKYRVANREARNEASSIWKKANRKHVAAVHANWVARNQERARELNKAYRQRNREEVRRRVNEWGRLNRAKKTAYESAREARKLRATPAWAIGLFISEAYELARKRTELFGFPWHVDHIVPLKNPLVCGLHVEHNLRVIPGTQNMSKGNRHWPDMPGVA